MDSVSPLPQNWLMRTEEPLWSPKMTSWMTKTGMLATRTAARSNSPTGLRAAGPDGASISPLFRREETTGL